METMPTAVFKHKKAGNYTGNYTYFKESLPSASVLYPVIQSHAHLYCVI